MVFYVMLFELNKDKCSTAESVKAGNREQNNTKYYLIFGLENSTTFINSLRVNQMVDICRLEMHKCKSRMVDNYRFDQLRCKIRMVDMYRLINM